MYSMGNNPTEVYLEMLGESCLIRKIGNLRKEEVGNVPHARQEYCISSDKDHDKGRY